MSELTYACQNCLHELISPVAVCPECTATGAVAHKNQIQFFSTQHNFQKPELLYCNRCSFKTIHQLTHCPNCNTAVKNFLLGPGASRLMTRREGSNAEIVIGCLVLVGSLIIGVIVSLVTATSTTNEKLLIGLAVVGILILIGLGFFIKGIIGKLIGGR